MLRKNVEIQFEPKNTKCFQNFLLKCMLVESTFIDIIK